MNLVLEDVRASLDESKEQMAEYRKRAAAAEMAAEQRLELEVRRFIAWLALVTLLAAAVPWIVLGWFLYQNSTQTYQGVKWLFGMARWLM